jgi:hypothetical protein
MSYESRIGWRYLYRGEGDRSHLVGLISFVLIAALGLGLALASDGGSGWGIILTGIGMMGAVLFGLLWVFSVFTTVSVLGVVLGVAAMTLVLAVTSGFQQQFQDKVLGVNAHVIIMKNNQGFSEYRDIEKVAWAADKEVIAATPRTTPRTDTVVKTENTQSSPKSTAPIMPMPVKMMPQPDPPSLARARPSPSTAMSTKLMSPTR